MGKENREKMMTDQPDKIFREKLSRFEKPAPTNAWARIETGLDVSKKSPFAYWRVAAAVLALATISYVILDMTQESPTPIAEVSSLKDSNPSRLPETPNGHDVESSVVGGPETLPTEGVESTEATPIDIQKRDRNRSTPAAGSRSEQANPSVDAGASTLLATAKRAEDVTKETLTESPEKLSSVDSYQDAKQDPTYSPQEKERESITLVMTVHDTDAYLEKNSEHGATSGSRKTSTLKRVLQKASELKNNDQDPFGDLRQMKNEILALNFKSTSNVTKNQ